MKEKQWVRRVREEGDRKAFESLFRAYYKRLHGFAYSYTGQAEAAEDVVQSVFLRIWSNRESWDPPGTVKQYLFAAIRNEALNKLRHQKVADDAEDEVIHSFRELQDDEEPFIIKQESRDVEELRKKIQAGIDQLPPKCRQIFLLNRRSGLTYIEIADYLGVSINTVNTQMGRALKSLRETLSDYIPGLIAAGISRLFF
ncbi:MAG: RNA polymerase sigma-70 factor [Balneolaceae bacterium]|nr:RNA polymerase sigma-70 factor [Balneolaceae bacterium]